MLGVRAEPDTLLEVDGLVDETRAVATASPPPSLFIFVVGGGCRELGRDSVSAVASAAAAVSAVAGTAATALVVVVAFVGPLGLVVAYFPWHASGLRFPPFKTTF